MEKNMRSGKLPAKVKFGYGLGTVGDSIPYTLFFSYFIFYLTNYVGMAPALAGTISFLSVLWNAVAGPVVGYLSDHSKSPKGRRRPLLAATIIPYALVIILSFAPVPFSGTAAFVYYLIIGMLFQTGYAAWKGAWDALGAELTQDYTERNNVRFCISLAAYPALIIASSGPIFMVGLFPDDPRMGWFIGAIVCAGIVAIGGVICWATTKGYEYMEHLDNTSAENEKRLGVINMVKGYGRILKAKAYRRLTIMQFVFCLGYTVLTNATVYCLTYNAGLSESQQSIFWVINSVIALVLSPVIVGFANKFDKKLSVYVFISVTIVGYFVFYFIGISGFVGALLFAVSIGFATTVFYGVMYSLIYDCCDIHELATGERAEGSIMAMSQLAQTLASSVAGLLFGMLLTMIGYDPANITEQTVHGILTIVTIVPAVFAIASLLILALYKVTPKRFQNVLDAIEARKEGKEIDLSEFKDII